MLLNCLQAVGRRAFSLHSSVAARVLGVTIDSLGEYLDEDLVEGVDYCYRAAADSAAGAGPELFFSINGFQCKLLRPRPSRPPSAASLRIYSNLFESLRLPPGADMPLPPPSLPRLDHCLFSCSLSQKQPLPAALAVMQRSPAGRAGMRARACMHSDRVRSHVSLTRCPLFSLQPRDARAAVAASACRAHVMRLAACALTLLAVVHVPAATSGGGGGGGGGDGPTIHSTRTATRPGLWKSA